MLIINNVILDKNAFFKTIKQVKRGVEYSSPQEYTVNEMLLTGFEKCH